MTPSIYARRLANQEHFQGGSSSIFSPRREIDFLVYPTVRVIPPTREELSGHEKYQALLPFQPIR